MDKQTSHENFQDQFDSNFQNRARTKRKTRARARLRINCQQYHQKLKNASIKSCNFPEINLIAISRIERAPNVKHARAPTNKLLAMSSKIEKCINQIMKNEIFHRSISDHKFRGCKCKLQCLRFRFTHEDFVTYPHKSNIFCKNLFDLQGSPKQNLIPVFPRHFFLCETT